MENREKKINKSGRLHERVRSGEMFTSIFMKYGDGISDPLRRLVRRSAKLVWWAVTFKLGSKLRAHLDRDITSQRFSATEKTGHASAFPLFASHVLDEAEKRLERFAPFDSAQYFAMHGDVASLGGQNAAWHAVRYGGQEGRALFRDEAVACAIGMVARELTPVVQNGLFPLVARTVPLGIYCSSQGDSFTIEIARDLASALCAAGGNVRLLDETASIDDRPSICLFIAPHQFFFLGQGTGWLREEIVTGSFMLNTEPPHTIGFSRAMPHLMMARGVVDIHAQTARLLSNAGVEALSVQFGLLNPPSELRQEDRTHPLFRVLPKAAQGSAAKALAWENRSLDVSFLGTKSPARERFFARHAARFAEYEAFLYCSSNRMPLAAKGGVLTRIATHIAMHSKISLNIHRDEFGYFEWYRIVKMAIYTGSIVVSDACLPHSGFVAGVNYFEENHRYIPDLIDWLLRSEEGRAAAQQVLANNEALFRRAPSREETLGPIANFLWRGLQ